MENLLISFNVIMPTFVVLAAGYLLKHKHIVTEEFFSQANKLVFKFFFPCLLFHNIYHSDLTQVFNGKLIAFSLSTLLILIAALWIIVPKVVKEPKQRGVVMQGIFRSNYLIFGVSIVNSVFGEGETAVAAMLSALLIPTFNFFSVIVLEVFTSGQKVKLSSTVKSIATNPLILSTLLAVVFSLCSIPLPTFAVTSIKNFSQMATPLALLVLGGEFDFANAKGNVKIALTCVLLKLVVIPCIFIPAAIICGFRGPELLAASLAFATPVAVSSYIMAQQAKADHQLAGQLVVYSSCFCLFTIFILIFLLKQFSLI